MRANFQRLLIVFLTCFLCGCGGGGGNGHSSISTTGNSSQGDQAVTGGATDVSAEPQPTTASIRIEQTLSRSIPSRVSQQRFEGFDSSGETTFGPELMPKTAVVFLQGVPAETTLLRMELLDGTEIVGRASIPITLVSGETLTLRDIAFEFVSVVLSELRLAPQSTTLSAGFTTALRVTGVYEDGTERDVTSNVDWEVDEQVASIDSAGTLTAIRVGRSDLTARLGSLSDTSTLQVTAAVPVSLRIEPETAQTVDDPVQFRCFVLYSDGQEEDMTQAADWGLDNEESASVSQDGLATPIVTFTAIFGPPNTLGFRSTTPATVEVVATLDTLSATGALTVQQMDTVRGFGFRQLGTISAPGTTRKFQLIANFSDQASRDITAESTWSTSSVENITSLGAGQFTIGADVPHGTFYSTRFQFGYQSSNPGHSVDRFAFAASFTDAGIRMYQVDHTGGLEFIEAESTGTGARNLVMHPSGRQVYSLDVSGTIYVCDIGPSGTLGPGQLLADDVSPLSGVVTTDGKSLLAASSNGVYHYSAYIHSFDQSGELKVRESASDIELDPQGRFLFVATSQGEIGVYSLSGLLDPFFLTRLDSQTFDSPPGAGSGTITIHPSGNYLYVASFNRSTVTVYSVSQNGALSLLQTLPTGDTPLYADIDPSGKFLYVPNLFDTTLSIFEVNGDGTLIPKPGLNVSVGCRSVTTDPGGLFAYVTNSSESTLSTYSIEADGSLSFLDSETVAGARDVVTTP